MRKYSYSIHEILDEILVKKMIQKVIFASQDAIFARNIPVKLQLQIQITVSFT